MDNLLDIKINRNFVLPYVYIKYIDFVMRNCLTTEHCGIEKTQNDRNKKCELPTVEGSRNGEVLVKRYKLPAKRLTNSRAVMYSMVTVATNTVSYF